MHGKVALCTQYTLGTVCLWCLVIQTASDTTLPWPALCAGPVYEYGSGIKRSGPKGHCRAPVVRIQGPLNATEAQRQAALPSRDCTLTELDEELQRLPDRARLFRRA